MRPLISYYGGKQRMASRIVPLIPPHQIYCEPFAGSAAVFFAKSAPREVNDPTYKEVLNDQNSDLINLYAVCRSDPRWQAIIEHTPFSSHWRTWAKAVLQSDQKSKVSRAVAKYIAHQQGFAGSDQTGWAFNKQGANMASAYEEKKRQLGARKSRLNDVYLDCCDAVDCIQKWDTGQTFFYVDPPYLNTQSTGMGQWSSVDLKRLTNCLNMAKGSFIVSGYGDHGNHIRGAVSLEVSLFCRPAMGAQGALGASQDNGQHLLQTKDRRIEVLWMRGPASAVSKTVMDRLSKQTCFTGPLLGPCPLPLIRKSS